MRIPLYGPTQVVSPPIGIPRARRLPASIGELPGESLAGLAGVGENIAKNMYALEQRVAESKQAIETATFASDLQKQALPDIEHPDLNQGSDEFAAGVEKKLNEMVTQHVSGIRNEAYRNQIQAKLMDHVNSIVSKARQAHVRASINYSRAMTSDWIDQTAEEAGLLPVGPERDEKLTYLSHLADGMAQMNILSYMEAESLKKKALSQADETTGQLRIRDDPSSAQMFLMEQSTDETGNLVYKNLPNLMLHQRIALSNNARTLAKVQEEERRIDQRQFYDDATSYFMNAVSLPETDPEHLSSQEAWQKAYDLGLPETELVKIRNFAFTYGSRAVKAEDREILDRYYGLRGRLSLTQSDRERAVLLEEARGMLARGELDNKTFAEFSAAKKQDDWTQLQRGEILENRAQREKAKKLRLEYQVAAKEVPILLGYNPKAIDPVGKQKQIIESLWGQMQEASDPNFSEIHQTSPRKKMLEMIPQIQIQLWGEKKDIAEQARQTLQSYLKMKFLSRSEVNDLIEAWRQILEFQEAPVSSGVSVPTPRPESHGGWVPPWKR